jgi:hypothetical protein
VCRVNDADLQPGQQYFYQVLGTSDSSSSDAVRERSPKTSKLFNFTVSILLLLYVHCEFLLRSCQCTAWKQQQQQQQQASKLFNFTVEIFNLYGAYAPSAPLGSCPACSIHNCAACSMQHTQLCVYAAFADLLPAS